MYTDAFGNYTLPPSEYGYDSFILTGNATFVWPYNTDGSPYPVAKVMDFACQAGNIVTLPNATEVSTGEDFLIRNVGASPLTVHNADGVQIATVDIGAASYFYLTDNTAAAGVYGVIGFGVGTSTADAASLVGYGIKAIGASLNQAHPTFPTGTGITLDDSHRAKLIVFTGGAATFPLTETSTLGDDYFVMFRNEGTGTATIDPASSELVDGMASMQIQPGESLMLICTGTQWYTVGYGRSTLYQFTQLTKDVSAGGTITLTAAEASNKLITFIGNPTGAVNVVVPSIVAVYYTQSAISTAQSITLKTAAGSGTGIDQGARIIALCDGTNIVSAQSAVANTSVSLSDGSAAIPSLYFATQTNTGLFKSSTQDVGVTVNGSSVGVFGSTGLQTTTIGPSSTQRHALPAVSSDTVALLAATQTLTNKTFTSPTITGAALTGGSINNTPIGGTTPAAGAFTTLSANGNVTLGDSGSADSHVINGVVAVDVNSATAALTITQTGTGNAFVVEDSASTDPSPFVIDQDGSVISGYTSAVGSALAATAARITTVTNTSLAGGGVKVARYRASTNLGADVELVKSASTTIGTTAAIASGETIGAVTWSAAGDSSNFYQAAKITGLADGTPGTGSMPGRLVFSTTPSGSATPVERMRIDANGNVGFGGIPSANGGMVRFANNATGATLVRGVLNDMTAQSDVTNSFLPFRSQANTADASFTLNNLSHFSVAPLAFGAASTVVSQYGFIVESGLTGATNNYGFYSNIPAAAGRWNFYANGTAANYFAGDLRTNTVVTQATTPSANNTGSIATASSLLGGIRTSTPTANINLQMPTGTNMDAAFQELQSNHAFEWSVINLAAVTHAITVTANTDHTVVGNMVVAANSSGRFLTRKTAANTFITYRVA